MSHWRSLSIALVCFVAGLAVGLNSTGHLLVPAPASAAAGGSSPPPGQTARAVAPADDGKLHIICFGAHPDDCELRAAGVAAMWAAKGHHVKFVSVTNGDIGHWRDAGGPLARRRKAEVE